jgi:hypothetical protein
VRNHILYFYALEQVLIYSTKFVSHFSDFNSFLYEFLNPIVSFELNQKNSEPKEKLHSPAGRIHATAQTAPQAETVVLDPLGAMATRLPTGTAQG